MCTALPARYHKGRLSGKRLCKLELQRGFGLEQRAEAPIFAMVTRMTEQKGFDLVERMLDELMQYNDMQFFMLGSGDKDYEDFMRNSETRYKGRLCAFIGYNEELSHRVYAGADFLLMPARCLSSARRAASRIRSSPTTATPARAPVFPLPISTPTR